MAVALDLSKPVERAEHHGEGRLEVGRRASPDDPQVVEDDTKLPSLP